MRVRAVFLCFAGSVLSAAAMSCALAPQTIPAAETVPTVVGHARGSGGHDSPGEASDWMPSSATGAWGAAGFVLGVLALNLWPALQSAPAHRQALLLMAFAAGPMLLHDARREGSKRGRAGRAASTQQPIAIEWARVATKLTGLAATVGLLTLAYWVLPEYSGDPALASESYDAFFALCAEAAPWVVAPVILYFFWMDRRMEQPCDGYWHMGRLVLGRGGSVDRAAVANHLRTWAVKGFFLPLMFSYLAANASFLRFTGWPDFLTGFEYVTTLLFSIDLAFVSCGYLLTLRWNGSHVRSAEPTALGWVAALICYMPFWRFGGDHYLRYWSDRSWHDWLQGEPALLVVWGLAILFFEAVFVWATICFGLRFSNLTHRGIVRTGPYYFTKHPAYVAKLCAFVLIALPWLDPRGSGQAIRNCLLFAGLAFVYWLRAKTEERHLARVDGTYAVYASEIQARHRRWAARILRKTPPAP